MWDEKSNRIRSECLDGMTYTFNYLPALAKKTIHTHEGSETCFLCEADPVQTVLLTEPFSQRLRVNNYPYHETQTMLAEREHMPILTRQSLVESLLICNRYGLNCAFSTHGSGASFPEHAHVHMFSTNLPIYDIAPKWHSISPIKIGSIEEYPSSVLVIESAEAHVIIDQLLSLLENIESELHGYNLQYSSKNKRLLFFPRQAGPSEMFDGQVFGAPTVSGIFSPDARGYVGRSIDEAIQLIEQRYLEISGIKMKRAIKEIVFPKEFGLDVIIPNMKQP